MKVCCSMAALQKHRHVECSNRVVRSSRLLKYLSSESSDLGRMTPVSEAPLIAKDPPTDQNHIWYPSRTCRASEPGPNSFQRASVPCRTAGGGRLFQTGRQRVTWTVHSSACELRTVSLALHQLRRRKISYRPRTCAFFH